MNATISATDIALRLNLRKHPRSWRGVCPCCQYAGNVFSVRQRPGEAATPYCANGCSRDDLNDELARIISGYRAPTVDGAVPLAEKRAAQAAKALALWTGSEPAGHAPYLAARGLPSLAGSAALRFRGDCGHPEGGRYPAMVALVQSAAGDGVAVHRTYLRADRAAKAAMEPAKASLGPVWGGAVRLQPVAPELVIGEGIETSASAGLLLDLPAWAAVNAGNLATGLVLPPDVRSVVIAADPDEPGERAARAAALRWHAEGRRVRIARPNRAGHDFNEVLMERAHG